MNDRHEYFREVNKTLKIVLFFNLFVALPKVIYGIIIHSASITADGFHSLGDSSSNIIGLIGIFISSRPVDKDHPYGHKKYETVTTIGIAMMLCFLALKVIHDAIERFRNPIVPHIDMWSFAIMFATLAVNIYVMRYEYAKGKRIKSDVLVADSHHTRSDIFVSSLVIVTLIAVKIGYPILDTVAAIVIAVLIMYSAVEIFRESSSVLCDRAVVPIDKVYEIAMKVPGVRDCHNIRTRGREDDIHMDLHVYVDTDMHVNKAHDLATLIEDNIKKEIEGVVDVVVHIEPLPPPSQRHKKPAHGPGHKLH